MGYNDDGTVRECYSTGSVLGRDYVGGLVGENYYRTVSQCYSTGSVLGRDYVGGLVGWNGDYGTVRECYSVGSVSGRDYVGGLVGYNDYGTVLGSYWDVESSGLSSSDAGRGKTTAEMKQRATYTGWDFANVWDIVEGQSYPYLRALGPTQKPEGEGVMEGTLEGTPEGEGVVEGTLGGTPEGEGVVEGIVEGQVEGVMEGAVEGEGMREGEGEGGTQPSPIEILCGCNRSKSDSGGLKNLLDFILIGAMLLILNSAMAKKQ